MQDEVKSLRVGNFSGYYGDRVDVFDELLATGVDVLTGDYLAELTMFVLRKTQMRGGPGYATGFVRQMQQHLPAIAKAGVKIVCNAGGLDPLGCAEAIREISRAHGLNLKVAAITGDDVLTKIPGWAANNPEMLVNLDTHESFDVPPQRVLAANAYLGAWPIVEALDAGADVVICPRVTDASLVIGPVAQHFGWKNDDFDRLAGALWAGHAIECGGQVSGGNYSFFYEEGLLGIPGMPIAEISDDGSSVITKSDGTGGIVSVDSVKAQLLYEVGGPMYKNPDVVGDLATVRVEQLGKDSVRLHGATGYAPPDTAKLSLCFEGGYRNSITIGITGLRVEEKLAWLRQQVDILLGGHDQFESYRWTVIGPKDPRGATVAEATAWVVITARADDSKSVSRRAFTDAISQLGVSSIPGCYFNGPPQKEKSAAVQWPALVAKSELTAFVHIDDEPALESPWPDISTTLAPNPDSVVSATAEPRWADADADVGAVENISLGDYFGTRSGDKAGLANVGVWARSEDAYEWLSSYLTVDRFKALVTEAADMRVQRHALDGILGLNFVVYEYLEKGVATSTNIDYQAKGLGEFLGSRTISVPSSLMDRIGRRDAQVVTQ